MTASGNNQHRSSKASSTTQYRDYRSPEIGSAGMALPGEQSNETRRRVLIVDDEDQVLQLFKLVLENHGFSVTAATEGQSAVNFFRQLGTVDLLITDIQMPGQSGIELAKELAGLQPNLPVLFMTGSNLVPATTTAQRCRLLRKPFSAKTLIASVEQLLIAS